MKKLLYVVALMAAAGTANAESLVNVSSFAVDTAMLGTIAGVVLTGLGGIWGVRKLIKFINRS